MGKRSKNDGAKVHDTKKVKKTNNNKKQTQNIESKSSEELSDSQVKSDAIPKKIVFDDNGTPSLRQDSQISTTISSKHSANPKSMQDLRSKTKSTSNSKNKKIVLGDEDDEHQVPVNNTRNRKNTQIIQNEDDVKEEDIDKFCDELEEEDNEEYENWVKLIEAKLGSNKQKS